jgi:hypothetical protein
MLAGRRSGDRREQRAERKFYKELLGFDASSAAFNTIRDVFDRGRAGAPAEYGDYPARRCRSR